MTYTFTFPLSLAIKNKMETGGNRIRRKSMAPSGPSYMDDVNGGFTPLLNCFIKFYFILYYN